jgi:hypothetical protein
VCSGAFPFSVFLRLSSCRLYSRMCAPCLICALNIPSCCYCFLLPSNKKKIVCMLQTYVRIERTHTIAAVSPIRF